MLMVISSFLCLFVSFLCAFVFFNFRSFKEKNFKSSQEKNNTKPIFTVKEITCKLMSEARVSKLFSHGMDEEYWSRQRMELENLIAYFEKNNCYEQPAMRLLQIYDTNYSQELLDEQLEKVGQQYLPRPELGDEKNVENLTMLWQLYKAYMLLKQKKFGKYEIVPF